MHTTPSGTPGRSQPAAAGSGEAAFALGGPSGGIAPEARWRGWSEVRADLRSALLLVAVLALTGIPAGLLWWGLAPRADFRVTESGPVPVGDPPLELSVAGDSVLALILAGLGLLAGAAAWGLRRRRGVATVAALALGAGLAALLAWQVGELLAPGPTEAELADVGGLVTTPLSLAALPALAVAPFCAVLAYLVAVLVARTDDLGRIPESGTPSTPVPAAAGEEPVDAAALR